ncbi:MFS transporter [Micrococcus luteus]|uniref:MFS transporter n=1 Tax=Micrococcus luteus TaxID=1270 RepID=UPI00080DB286
MPGGVAPATLGRGIGRRAAPLAIIADLHLDLTDAQWVNSLYAVLLAALLLSTGNLADRWGRKRLFLAGLVVFVGGSGLGVGSSTEAEATGGAGSAGVGSSTDSSTESPAALMPGPRG